MYKEISKTNRKCRFCNKKLGYYIEKKKIKTFKRYYYSIKPFVTKNKKFYRSCCIDCFYKKFKRLPKQPNVLNSDFPFLLELSEELLKEKKKKRFGITKEKMLQKYGKEEGQKRWDGYRKKQRKNGNTLEYFQEVYGLSEGKEKYEKVCKMKAITPENMKKVHGNKWKEKYYNWLFSEKKIKYYSNISQKVFNNIVKTLKLNKKYIFYGDNNSEKHFSDDTRIYFYDYIDEKNKICIEFNGEHCHPNKEKMNDNQWNEWKCVYTGKTAYQKYNEDKQKEKIIKEKGYTYYIIWYEDWIVKQNKIIEGVKKIYEKGE